MTTYDMPIPAKLVVHLDSGENWDATPEDLEKFNLVTRHDAYVSFDRTLDKILRAAGLLGENRDLTDAKLNPLRYLVEMAVAHPDMLADPKYAAELQEDWDRVAAIERALQHHHEGRRD